MKLIRIIFIIAGMAIWSIGKVASQNTPNFFLHTVTKGQSLYSIASMYHVTIEEIVRLNPGSDVRIKAGEALKIPQKTNNQVTFHTIQPGETLYKLTVRYGISAQRICQANPGLSAKNFRIGQVVAIPPQQTESAEKPTQQPVANQPTPSTQKESEGLKPNCRDMHRIQRKETVYSISKLYGITEEELIAANPEIRNKKLKKGKFLCIPYAKDPSSGNYRPTTADRKTSGTPLSNDELFRKNQKESKKYASIKAAVLLPFMTHENANHNEQMRMVEFYEGFLIAVDSLKQMGVSVDLYTYDTGKTAASANQILNKKELKDMDIIFGPAYPDQVKGIADFAQKHKIRLVIPFTSKSNEVFNNPYIHQVNTPQSYLYSEVYEHFTRKFTTSNIIFLDAMNGDKEKDEFIKGLKEELKNKRIPFQELQGDAITPEALKSTMNHVLDNVFIPTSGKNTALIKLLPQLTIAKRENPDYRIMLFGYPEWQTYTYDHLSSFFELDTYFYSSFYTNNLFPSAVQFNAAYRKWFSKDMANTYPKYGMLGFDIGFFFLKGLHQYGTQWEENMNNLKISPIQTGFKFDRVNNWGGFINRKVFFIHFTKEFELIKLDFE